MDDIRTKAFLSVGAEFAPAKGPMDSVIELTAGSALQVNVGSSKSIAYSVD